MGQSLLTPASATRQALPVLALTPKLCNIPIPCCCTAAYMVEGLRISALDLSFNRIQCNSWEELEPVLDQLLGQRIVHLLELGNNYLPALDILK